MSSFVRRTFGGVTRNTLSFTPAATYVATFQLHTSLLNTKSVRLNSFSASTKCVPTRTPVVAAQPIGTDLIIGLTSELQILDTITTLGWTFAGVTLQDVFPRDNGVTSLVTTIGIPHNGLDLNNFIAAISASQWVVYQNIPVDHTITMPHDLTLESDYDNTLLFFASLPIAFSGALTDADYIFDSSYTVEASDP